MVAVPEFAFAEALSSIPPFNIVQKEEKQTKNVHKGLWLWNEIDYWPEYGLVYCI